MARGRATWSSCSVNTPTGHDGSTHSQVRLRHRTTVGTPKQGMPTIVTVRRPWELATTPHDRHPITVGADSTVTCTPWVAVGTDHVEAGQADQHVTPVTVVIMAAGRARRKLRHGRGPRRQVVWKLLILRTLTLNPTHPALPARRATPTTTTKSHYTD